MRNVKEEPASIELLAFLTVKGVNLAPNLVLYIKTRHQRGRLIRTITMKAILYACIHSFGQMYFVQFNEYEKLFYMEFSLEQMLSSSLQWVVRMT